MSRATRDAVVRAAEKRVRAKSFNAATHAWVDLCAAVRAHRESERKAKRRRSK